MEIEFFKASIGESVALLAAMQPLLPELIDQKLIDYLTKVQTDETGLRLLRAAIFPKK